MFQANERQLQEKRKESGSSLWELEHWGHLQELFHLAGTAPPGERTRILREACSDDLLVDRALELLSFSEEPLPAAPVEAAVPLGTRVGPYALLRHLGTGGLGSVYLAERMVGGVLQRCALKVLSMHAAGPQFESRFQREQQILATLNHPNITRLLDAGFSETNQPYLTMEYVDGVDLVRHCDAHRLNVRERLELFLQICEAVAYAHRNLTVHLDLKPSNVLVSTAGQVKLLDFGTSKLINPDNASTTTVLATPAYAAPEQLRNEPVTTSCDVYSLGAILYELLSGERPFQSASVAMVVERAFQEQEPPTVTSVLTAANAETRGVSETRLQQLLEGDLSTIVARCLHSRPRDRYPSVDAFAEDIRRYLTGMPVLTRPQTARYRWAKFVRRNRKAATATAVALVVIAASVGFAAFRQHEALRAAERAVQMQNFMTQVFRLAHSGATGKPASTVADMLQVGARVLPSFIADPADQRAARLSIAESMYDNDDFKDALPILLTLGEEARRSGDVPVEAKADVLSGDIEYTQGNTTEGDALTTRALSLSSNRAITPANRTQIVAMYVSNHDDMGDRGDRNMQMLRAAIQESEREHVPEEETASAMNILGLGLQARGHLDEAEQYFLRSLAIYQRTPYAMCDMASTEKYLGYMHDKRGDSAGALSLLQQSYEGQRQCAGADDLATLSSQAWVGTELTYLGRPGEAIALIEPSMPTWRRVVGPDSQHLTTPLSVLVRAYLDQGRCKDAEVTGRENLRVVQRSFAKRSSRNAVAESRLAEALACEKRDAEALPYAQASIDDYPPNAAGSVQVDAGSTINADGQGYVAVVGGQGAGPSGGSDSNHGGSYGGAGYGQLASSVYGSTTAPVDLGSAGSVAYGSGGNGGGALKLVVTGTLTNNGVISANAGALTGYSSGGAGGSVYVITQTLAGAGVFTATGATNPSFQTKDGGGGRVAVDYVSATGFSGFTGSTASGGPYGSVGTAAFFDTSVTNSNLNIYQNFTFAANSTITYNAITVQNSGVLMVGGGTTVNVAAALTVTGSSTVNVQSINNTALVNGTWQGTGVTFNAGSVQVDAGSNINADGAGYVAADSTPGTGPSGGSDSNHGGSYGGAGSGDPASAVYGSSMAPTDLGSAGSIYSGANGNGGGAVKLVVAGLLANNGVISANAQVPTGYTSGGAGGSVYVITQTLAGAGVFTANGGLNPNFQTKDGGGGRIAVDYASAAGFTGFSGSTANGGVYGSPGTVVFVDTTAPNGNVSVYQTFAIAASTNTQFNSFTLASGGVLTVGGGAQVTVAQALHIAGTVTAQSINNTAQVAGVWQGQGVRIFAGSAQIDATGSLSADAQGYIPSAGPSAGSDSNHGGSYGGLGSNDTSGTYGSVTAPLDLGSGGSQYAGGGGYGGGAIELLVSGTLTNNGSISANADTPTGYSSGAAGGSVYVGAHTITGSGTYSANGGVSASYASKNGGGGRVAVDYLVNQGVVQNSLTALATASATAGTTSFVQAPISAFLQPAQSVIHGTATLQWFTDNGTATTVSLAGPKTETVATGAAAINTTTFDTTAFPDGAYQLRLNVLDAAGNVLQEVSKSVVINNSVLWYSGTLTANTHWTANNVYALDGTLVIPAGITLTIDAGTVVKALPGAEILVQTGGTLSALGTAANPVIFTTFDDSSVGGNTDFNQGVSVPSPGEWGGVVVQGGTYSSNPDTFVRYAQTLLSGTISASTTLVSTQNYLVTGTLTVAGGETLTVQPGTVIKFNAGAGIDVQPGATLLANGTLAQPIYFTSFNDTSVGGNAGSNGAAPAPGDWNSILIDAATASFQHVQMQYGGGPVGSSNQAGMLESDGAAVVAVTDTTLAYSYAIGLQTGYPNGGGDTITVTDSSFYSNEDRAINAYPGSVVHVVNSTVDSNSSGIFAHGGTIDVANSSITNSLGTQFGQLTICCGGSFSSLQNNDVYTTTPGVANYVGLTDPTGTSGNISANPVYMNVAQHDYRPTYGSPLIDAANATAANYPGTDAFGIARYNATLVTSKTGTPDANGLYPDIGAFEFVQGAPSNLDFTVSNVNGPATANVGTQATVTWTVTNVGTGTAYGPWHDAVYLITAPNTNPVEVLAGQLLEGAGVVLGPGASYSATGSITVPGTTVGDHRWEVKTNVLGEVFEGANTANNTSISLDPVAVDLTELTPGAAPLTGSFSAAGQSSFYKVVPAASQAVSVQLALASGAAGSVQLFVGGGYVPSPQHYDYQQTGFDSSTGSLTIPASAAQTYYVTAYAQNVPSGPVSFTIQATSVQFSLTNVTPNTAVTQGSSTLTFIGGGFTYSTSFLLVSSSGATYAPTSTFLSDSTRADVTFSLTNVPIGSYTAEAINGSTITLANAVTLTSTATGTPVSGNAAGNVQVTMEVPEAFRAGFPSLITLDYTNIAGYDIPAPLIYVNAVNATLQEVPPPCTGCNPNFTLQYGATFTSGLVLGINPQGPAGVLPAGASGSIQFYATPGGVGTASFYASPDGNDIVGTKLELYSNICFASGDGKAADNLCTYTVNPTGAYGGAPYFCNSLVPTGESAEGAGRACLLLLNKAGFTYAPNPLQSGDLAPFYDNNTYISGHLSFAGLNAVLAADATALSAQGDYEYDVQKLLAFELNSDGFRDFNTRYHQGAFGFGPSEPFDITLSGSAGSLLEHLPDGTTRSFPTASPAQANVYLGVAGDYGTAALQADGTWLITEADGTVYHFTGNANSTGLLDYIQDRTGNKISVTYSFSQVASVSDAFGDQLAFQYDTLGHITKITDATGQTATLTYTTLNDSQHSTFLRSVTDPRGTTIYTWNQGGSGGVGYLDDSCVLTFCQPAIGVARVAYPDGSHTYYTYDSAGRLAGQSRDGGAQAFTFAYNGDGSITSTDALGKQINVAANGAGLLASITDPLGGVARFRYDAEGKVVSGIGPLGDSQFITYDSLGNPASVTSSLGNLSSFSFLADQSPSSFTDPSGNFLAFGYDASFDLLSTSDATGAKVTYTYDAQGHPLTRTNRRGATTKLTYNANGLLASKTYSTGAQVSYTYDNNLNLQTVTTAAGVTRYTYNTGNHLTAIANPDGTSLQYSYNANGQRTSMTDSTGFTTNYTYDTVGRLSGLTSGSGASLVSYTYDANGRLAGKTLGNGTSLNVTYDADGRALSVVNYTPSHSTLSEYDYTYDLEGRPLTLKSPNGSFTYAYDLDGQLTSVTTPTGTIQYAYDASGNRTGVTTNGVAAQYLSNNLDQYISANGASFVYDADGNLLSGNGYTYTYNEENKVLTMVSASDAWSYTYDGLGNRISSTHNGTTTRYLVDPSGNGNVEAELNGSGAVLAHYTYGLDLTSSVQPSGAASYYHFDALGNTGQVTNASGTVVNSYAYLPFGEETVLAAGVSNPFTFDGEIGALDEGSGLYFMRNRWYNPAIGRFQQTDPVGLAGGPNPYTFVNNSPLTSTDPLGLDPSDSSLDYAAFNISVGVGVGAAVNLHNGETFLSVSVATGAGANASVGKILPSDGSTNASGDDVSDYLGGVSLNAGAYTGLGGGITGSGGKVSIEHGVGYGAHGGSITYSVSTTNPDLQAHLLPLITPQPVEIQNPNGFRTVHPDNPPDLCGTCITINLKPTNVPVKGPVDPNGKITSGYGDSGYVPAGAPITYTIFFENQPTATLPAQKVVVTDALASNLDWSTVELTQVAFNNSALALPGGSQTFNGQASVSTDPNPVKVSATLNPATGVLTWIMQSVDPVTGSTPANPLAGFLPPNNSSNAGFGSVTFTVKPKAGLPNGTAITNQGSIVFDVNAPIATNTVSNLLDTSVVTSAVNPLPSSSSSTSFTVSWTGSDPTGSGIASYNIYVSTDGGAYALWLSATTLTSSTFTGAVAGHSYAFVSLATNNVGIQQTTAAAAQTIAIVSGGLAAPTVTVTPGAASVTTAQTLSVAIAVSSTGVPTGSVVLSSGTYTSAATVLSSGKATIVVPAGVLATGSDTLMATYTPDSASSSTYSSNTGMAMVTVTAAASTQQVTVGTSPVGAAFTVDGTTYTSSQTFPWTVGSTHTLATTSPQLSNGAQQTFTAWSDGGASQP